MLLRGRYGANAALSKDDEKYLNDIRKSISSHNYPPLLHYVTDYYREYILKELIFFFYLEGICAKKVNNKYVINANNSKSFCIIDKDKTEVLGTDYSYKIIQDIIKKWISVGAPRRNSYFVEVWPKDIIKKQPIKSWRIKKKYSQIIFKLIK